MAELLLELFSEEIPARMQLPMAETLRTEFSEKLKAEGLFFSSVKTYVTPRRLVMHVEGLSLTQENKVIEKRGPRSDAPDKAIDGFARGAGLTKEQLTKRSTSNGEFYFAVTEQKGRPTKEILIATLEETISTLTWPKSMHWGTHHIRWVRPLRNICCIFGGEVLPVRFGHLEGNDESRGHHFLSPEIFNVRDFKSYKKDLENRYVILNTNDRKEIIIRKAEEYASSKNLKVIADNTLLDEVAGLVEWPQVLLGSISQDFMKLPEEVLISSIRTHQKYFCLRGKNSGLAPFFLVVSNMMAEDGGNNIIAGNERVLRARLSDANFFFEQDRKKHLSERIDALNNITFHARLGSLGEKVKRIQAVAKYFSVWVPHANLDTVERAAILCKTDLTTEMVGEFPELQGIMGYYYARHDDEPDEVASAIKEHYAPLGPSDNSPKSPVSIAIAVADKMDSLAGLFAINEKPTGSKDPFALRRAALGIIRIILENQLSVPLRLLIEHSLRQYPSSPPKKEGKEEKAKTLLPHLKKKKLKSGDVIENLLSFFEDRLKHLLKSEKVRHDLVSAVFSGGAEDDLLRLVRRVSALEKFLATKDGESLLAAYKRATNIVRIEEKKDGTTYSGTPSKTLLEQDEEKKLYDAMHNIRPAIKKLLKANEFEEAMKEISTLRSNVDAFFDMVTVNHKKSDLRKNRLKLLAQMRELLDEIADFTLIES